ncbi:hypothetical protein EVAR_57153_1 [Eumeta japonica]|uniref:Mos1 transposase HTH domain-containing protein n=1 Tax=Eumeta variegata TaxID=151549 RepID=A0A4C1YW63_EUMVA|nr:hypothetical protein EVAR_57153_1 [Eumeta japonica]
MCYAISPRNDAMIYSMEPSPCHADSLLSGFLKSSPSISIKHLGSEIMRILINLEARSKKAAVGTRSALACRDVSRLRCAASRHESTSGVRYKVRNSLEPRKDTLGPNAPPYSTVARWCARFNRGRTSIKDDPSSGRSATSYRLWRYCYGLFEYKKKKSYPFQRLKEYLNGEILEDDEGVVAVVQEFLGRTAPSGAAEGAALAGTVRRSRSKPPVLF